MPRCYLVRHAQTPWNVDNRVQGHSDVPLSPEGEAQAKRLGALFASRHLRGLFTSALQRSRQTAQAIASGNGHRLEPVVMQGLAEIHLGMWEGLTPTEINAQFPGAYQQWTTHPSTVTIPGAEPLDAFRRRVRQAMARVAATFQDGEYVVVSHGGVIASFLADVLDADYDATLRRLRLDNGGITAVEFDPSTRPPRAGSLGVVPSERSESRDEAHPPSVLWINATAHLVEPVSGASLARRG